VLWQGKVVTSETDFDKPDTHSVCSSYWEYDWCYDHTALCKLDYYYYYYHYSNHCNTFRVSDSQSLLHYN